jgi:hypothetical protein
MDRDDAQLESLLREHFAAKLDGQLGNAAARFLREVSTTEMSQPQMRLVSDDVDDDGDDAPLSVLRSIDEHRRSGWSAFAWSLGLAGAAVAAGIAVVMILVPLVQRPPANDDRVVIVPSSGDATPLVTPATDAPRDVEHALTWNTIDQGTVYLGGEVPLRSVVRQANETVRWYDPQHKAHVEMTVPRDEVMLVGYGSQ